MLCQYCNNIEIFVDVSQRCAPMVGTPLSLPLESTLIVVVIVVIIILVIMGFLF